jgi:AcrR family transcriptional regulator
MAAIRRAGLRLIFEHGYEAMSLRQLASAVGIREGSLYNHINTKQELLFELVKEHMEQLLQHLEAALAGIEGPVERLQAFVAFHVHYHLVRQRQVFVINSELRSLEGGNYSSIVGMRRAYENRLAEILEEGVDQGAFQVGDIRVTTYAILAMLTGVCTWYRPSGRLGRDEIVELYVGLVLHGLRWGRR